MVFSHTQKLVVIAAIAGVFFFKPQTVHARNTPQICNDGYALLNAKRYKAAIKALSQCLNKRSLTAESQAIGYLDRGLAYYFLGLDILDKDKSDKNWKKSDRFLEKALKDAEQSIKVNPARAAKAYCLRGKVYFELSWGTFGYDDLKKGRAMGAPESECQP